jgi:hypothetical protein
VRQHVPGKLATRWQDTSEISRRDSLERPAKPWLVRNAGHCRQKQRVQELLAELPVADPELSILVLPERQIVDE